MGLSLHMGHEHLTSSHFTRHLVRQNIWTAILKLVWLLQFGGPGCVEPLFFNGINMIKGSRGIYLLWKECWHGNTPSSSFVLKSSKQTAHVNWETREGKSEEFQNFPNSQKDRKGFTPCVCNRVVSSLNTTCNVKQSTFVFCFKW